jgi:hypothetical protein
VTGVLIEHFMILGLFSSSGLGERDGIQTQRLKVTPRKITKGGRYARTATCECCRRGLMTVTAALLRHSHNI